MLEKCTWKCIHPKSENLSQLNLSQIHLLLCSLQGTNLTNAYTDFGKIE